MKFYKKNSHLTSLFFSDIFWVNTQTQYIIAQVLRKVNFEYFSLESFKYLWKNINMNNTLSRGNKITKIANVVLSELAFQINK